MAENDRPNSARSQASATSGREYPKHELSPEMEAQLREVFNIFDQSGDGSIDVSEFHKIMVAVCGGTDITLAEVQSLIATIDDNQDGSVQLPEFLKLMSD
eukprot:CAMPEP_0185569428 /NCGR_PEP_ID=MMETSP0434-20130131/2053_1 /TAXON_ID=626734 ORGANISM="Favella taraikaensis, Strain Fe Narragansett Bay" /NCGR_SAMPLE_ID=MMETSP0434 /ASSEMBLY_ACC=CAM_ASM_000379 /LENGTH=99 /DNA_ID=CAMNT_0028184207 /DNA_START=15 /DNA_END=314 /DNA_ORIENTATION=-